MKLYVVTGSGNCRKVQATISNLNMTVDLEYLADKVPDNSLFSQNPQTRADIVRWQCWELAHFNNAVATVTFETVLKPQFFQQKPNQPIVDAATESLKGFARVLEEHLADRDYVVGNGITLADYSIINIEGFKEMIPFDWSDYPRLNAYFDRLRADPHWASTAPESPEAIGRKPKAA